MKGCIEVIKKKPMYRDLYLNTLKNVEGCFHNDEIFKTVLEPLLDEELVNSLFDSIENYVEDIEVTKEINNILSGICMRNPALCKLIIDRGGLTNVMVELKAISKSNDAYANSVKLNGLKFIDSIINDESQLDKFLEAGGIDVIHNIIKTDLGNWAEHNPTELLYATKETFNFNVDNINMTKKDIENKNPNLLYCFKIINQMLTIRKTCPDFRLIDDIISIIR